MSKPKKLETPNAGGSYTRLPDGSFVPAGEAGKVKPGKARPKAKPAGDENA